MKALFTLKSAINQSTVFAAIALVIIAPIACPSLVKAAELQTQGKDKLTIFEIKNSKAVVAKQNTQDIIQSLNYNQIVANDPYVKRLQVYLEKYNSPLAPYASEMIKQPQWQRALAISWVESNFCIHSIDNNCSGIGGAPGMTSWHKYNTKLDWFIDMAQLMEKPIYKEKYTTFKQMIGVYVQPGSPAWRNGAQQKYNELMAMSAEAESERLALVELSQSNRNSDLATLVP